MWRCRCVQHRPNDEWHQRYLAVLRYFPRGCLTRFDFLFDRCAFVGRNDLPGHCRESLCGIQEESAAQTGPYGAHQRRNTVGYIHHNGGSFRPDAHRRDLGRRTDSTLGRRKNPLATRQRRFSAARSADDLPAGHGHCRSDGGCLVSAQRICPRCRRAIPCSTKQKPVRQHRMDLCSCHQCTTDHLPLSPATRSGRPLHAHIPNQHIPLHPELRPRTNLSPGQRCLH